MKELINITKDKMMSLLEELSNKMSIVLQEKDDEILKMVGLLESKDEEILTLKKVETVVTKTDTEAESKVVVLEARLEKAKEFFKKMKTEAQLMEADNAKLEEEVLRLKEEINNDSNPF